MICYSSAQRAIVEEAEICFLSLRRSRQPGKNLHNKFSRMNTITYIASKGCDTASYGVSGKCIGQGEV